MNAKIVTLKHLVPWVPRKRERWFCRLCLKFVLASDSTDEKNDDLELLACCAHSKQCSPNKITPHSIFLCRGSGSCPGLSTTGLVAMR